MSAKCKIFIAKSAGFCFGVDRAVKIVYNKLDSRNSVATLGPIIHNRNVVEDLEKRGCPAVGIDDVRSGMTVIIRSHGVGRDVYDELERRGAQIEDATCPFVERIQRTALEKSREGCTILIAGDPSHPEVQGIRGFCEGGSYVFSDLDELRELLCRLGGHEKLCVLSQTTYNKEMWERCREYLEGKIPSDMIFDTICKATALRQIEAKELALRSDLMIIVGGADSSNTRKLGQVCQRHCRTLLVENGGELEKALCGIDLSYMRSVGISAGASTPAYIIKEVQQVMSEMLNKVENIEEENFDFEAEMEKTLKKIHKGQKVEGEVAEISDKGEVIVDIGTKHTGYILPGELSDDPSKKPEDIVSVGEKVALIVLSTNDQEGIVHLSKKRVDALIGLETIAKAKEEDTVLSGVVTRVIKGGLLVSSNGINVFVPASQAVARGKSLDDMLKKNVEFKILEVNEARQRAVGSIRVVERERRKAQRAKFFETASAGDVILGEVKSITDYGAFVDLGGVDGLVRKADISWKRIKHPSEVFSIGDKVEIKIKDLDPDTEKVSLVYKKDSENPWELFKASYECGQVIKTKIVSITSFGAFAQIFEGIDGLIHISQIANKRVDNVSDILSVGQEVEVKITDIDYDKKRISLSMRALLPAYEQTDDDEDSTEADE